VVVVGKSSLINALLDYEHIAPAVWIFLAPQLD
jgi:predicted GTPase